MGNTDTDSETIYLAFSRMINGYFKVAVFSVIFSSLHGKFVLHLFNPGVWNSQLMSGVCLIGSAFLYTVYLYLNFSGYMDIVIGAGKLMGFELPETLTGLSLPAGSLSYGQDGTLRFQPGSRLMCSIQT
jgi:D-alanyl-lipoteichoic acid acyltransferase DltB (MBOAT superfamily)